MFDPRGVLLRGLVQTAPELGAFVVFLQRDRGGRHLPIRVMDDECPDGGAVPGFDTLDTRARMGAHCLVHRLRATLSPRRTAMAGVEYLRPADTGIDSQFHFYVEY